MESAAVNCGDAPSREFQKRKVLRHFRVCGFSVMSDWESFLKTGCKQAACRQPVHNAQSSRHDLRALGLLLKKDDRTHPVLGFVEHNGHRVSMCRQRHTLMPLAHSIGQTTRRSARASAARRSRGKERGLELIQPDLADLQRVHRLRELDFSRCQLHDRIAHVGNTQPLR